MEGRRELEAEMGEEAAVLGEEVAIGRSIAPGLAGRSVP